MSSLAPTKIREVSAGAAKRFRDRRKMNAMIDSYSSTHLRSFILFLLFTGIFEVEMRQKRLGYPP